MKVEYVSEFFGFTVGKIYDFTNGKIVDKDGDLRPMGREPLHTIDELNKWCRSCSDTYNDIFFEMVPITIIEPFILVEIRDGRLLMASTYYSIYNEENEIGFVSEDGLMISSLSDYDTNLQAKFDKKYDIMKIYSHSLIHDTLKFSTEDRQVLWERE